MSQPLLLALEMSLHEDLERRALEGELTELETAWREAEELAAIVDGMFISPATEEAIAALKAHGAAGRIDRRV